MDKDNQLGPSACKYFEFEVGYIHAKTAKIKVLDSPSLIRLEC